MWFWLFLLSFMINIFLAFYVRWLFKSLETINMDVFNVIQSINEFSAHLSAVHEMEMFYGDQTLQELMVHATELSKDLTNLDLLLEDPDEKEENPVEETKA